MLYASALALIISQASSLCFSESFLESFTRGCSKSFGNITAAATTGPEKHPRHRPTSSMPTSTQSRKKDFKGINDSGLLFAFFIIYKIYYCF